MKVKNVLVVVLLASSCSLARSSGVSSVSEVMARAATGGELTASESILTAVMAMMTSAFDAGPQFNSELVQAVELLALEEMLVTQGPVVALHAICAAPWPELSEPGAAVERDIDEEGRETTTLHVVGLLPESELEASLEIQVENGVETSTVTILAGSWLLCAALEAVVEVDGESFRLDEDEFDANLELETASVEVPDAEEQRVVLTSVATISISVGALRQLLNAEELVLRFGDAAMVFAPSELEEVQQFLEYLDHETNESPSEAEPRDPSVDPETRADQEDALGLDTETTRSGVVDGSDGE